MLAFTDSDCEACPTWLEEIAASLAEPGTALVLGSRRNARESYSLRMAADYEAQRVEYVCTQDDSSLYYGYTGNLAAHREAFERCGLFMQIARGADTVFVSTVLKAYGPGSVRFAPKAQVRHLEINGVSDWYRKLGTYGRSSANYGAWSHTRPLGLRTRLKVMRRTIARNRYSWLRAQSVGFVACGRGGCLCTGPYCGIDGAEDCQAIISECRRGDLNTQRATEVVLNVPVREIWLLCRNCGLLY